MALFKLNENNKLKKMSLKNFSNEKQLQKLCEDNLEELFQVRFIATEFSIGDGYSGRLDTIGLDYDGNPVIIEYKLEKNSSILSQSLFYMDWLVNHKGDFEMAAKNKLGNDIKIYWTNPKMLLVAQEYNKYDKYAVNQIPYDIYLYKYLYYNNEELYLENINVQENRRYYIKEEKVDTENSERYVRKEYELDHHLSNCSEKAKNLYNELNEKILEISDQIESRINKIYVGYRTTKNFVEVFFKKNSLLIYVMKTNYDDPENRLEKVPESYRWSADSRMEISSSEDIEYALKIIKQSYESTL